MFSENRRQLGVFTEVEIVNKETGIALVVIPEKGAKVNRLTYSNGVRDFDVIDGYKTSEDVEQNEYSKSSILAPFPNRIEDGKYLFEGKEYNLPINMMAEHNAIHGFIEHVQFSLLASVETESGYSLLFRHEYLGDKEGYPFPFTIDVEYVLTGTGFSCITKVKNNGQTNMPFGHGWHPYFKTLGEVGELEMKLPHVEKIEVNERLIPTGKRTSFTDFEELRNIETVQFDTGFCILGEKRNVVLCDRNNNIQIIIDMGDRGSAYRYVQVFTPPKGCLAENTIAIEPMTCPANAFNSGEGLIVLKPEQVFSGSFSVSVGPINL